ncbi:hypothetical protein PAMP_011387 [Pampus punctatissimus]
MHELVASPVGSTLCQWRTKAVTVQSQDKRLNKQPQPVITIDNIEKIWILVQKLSKPVGACWRMVIKREAVAKGHLPECKSGSTVNEKCNCYCIKFLNMLQTSVTQGSLYSSLHISSESQEHKPDHYTSTAEAKRQEIIAIKTTLAKDKLQVPNHQYVFINSSGSGYRYDGVFMNVGADTCI